MIGENKKFLSNDPILNLMEVNKKIQKHYYFDIWYCDENDYSDNIEIINSFLKKYENILEIKDSKKFNEINKILKFEIVERKNNNIYIKTDDKENIKKILEQIDNGQIPDSFGTIDSNLIIKPLDSIEIDNKNTIEINLKK